MNLVILFGLPGAGKTFVGRLLAQRYGFFFYEGDDCLTLEMKEAIQTKTPFTDAMREVFFEQLIAQVGILSKKYEHLVVSQTFIKEAYRHALLAALPHAQFILIDADTPIRERRLQARNEYPLDLAYARTMVKNFEKHSLSYQRVINNNEGHDALIQQLDSVLSTH